MARIRTVKPEFWTSEQIVQCSPNARLLFIGLMNFADDNGVHPDKPMRIKMQVFPGDTFGHEDIDSMLKELDIAGLIVRYKAGGEFYLVIKGFTKHQKIDQPSYKYPLPDGQIPESPARRRYNSDSVRRTDGERSPPEGNGRECKGKEGNGKETSGAAAPADKSAKVSVTANDLVKTYGIDKDMAAQWLAVRKDKRMKLTPLAMERTIAECKKAGITLSAAVKLCCENSWAGFKAEYLANLPQSESPQAADPLVAERRELKYERQQLYADMKQLESLSLPIPADKRRRLSAVEERLREIGN